MTVLRVGAKAIFILLTLVLISNAVSRAGHAGVLTAIAGPLAQVLLAGWRWLGPAPKWWRGRSLSSGWG
ncbi:MAG: hypothetical protein R3E79_15765 [Caldilineaceae bacterium]